MDIIRSVFTFAMPLQEWLHSFGFVNTSGESISYLRNLKTSIVAFNVDMRDKLVATSSPPSETKELILRVIEKMLRQGETNVLTLGFGMMSDDPDAQVSCFNNIEYRHPNSSVNLLHQGVWKRLHQCIGDGWMRALLEETAIFLLCSKTCYIQVTGVPIYKNIKSASGVFVNKGEKSSRCATNVSRKGKQEGDLHKSKKQNVIHHKFHCDGSSGTELKQHRKRKKTEYHNPPHPKKARLQVLKDFSPSTSKGAKKQDQSPFNPYKFHLYMTQSYLYSTDLREKLPTSHPLSNSDSCLFDEVCAVNVTDNPKESLPADAAEQINPVFIDIGHLEELLQTLRENHKSCRYLTFLNTCCPVVSSKKKFPPKMSRRYQTTPTHVLLQDFVPPQKVYVYLRKVFITVIPEKLLGCRNNRNCFLKFLSEDPLILENECMSIEDVKAVKRLVYLGRYEKMCLGDIMKGIKTKTIPWLANIFPHCLKLHLLAKMIYWLMNNFIISLIKAFFYVTETGVYRNQLFFYRKKVWSKLHANGIRDLRRTGVLTNIKKMEVLAALQSGDSLGEATIRFLPKLRSLRPIANLGRQPPAIAKSTLPINKQLLNVLTVLSHLTLSDQSHIGAAKFGNDDIFISWRQFALNWKNHTERRPLYFVKTDIRSCFDGILQEKLLNIIQNLLSKAPDEDVITRKFVSHHVSGGRVVSKFKKIASGFGEYIPDFEKFIKKFIEDNKLSNMVFVNQMINQQMHLEEVFEKLKCHVLNNLIKIGRQYYKQTIGISQGSVLSTLLCNIYYGQMEERFMPQQADEIMMRMVDDSIFVTPCRERAEMFLNLMIQGNSEYNFSINTDKILVNFDCEHESLGRMKRNFGEWFPWCGLLFNTKTLEVGNDLLRYQGVRMRHTLTIDVSMTPGLTMKKKLLMSLRPKCHAVFLDTKLNSLEVCVSNSYRLLLLTALKFHCYASCLPENQRVQDNPHFFHSIIHDIGKYLYSQASVQCKRKFGASFVFDVPKEVMEWLSWYAFLAKLKCHPSSYKKLIQMIKQSLKCTEKRLYGKDEGAPVALRRLCGRDIPVELKRC